MENMARMSSSLAQFYAGKRVFLTGHTGFKGAWFLKMLTMLGATVKGYALAPDQPETIYQAIQGDTLCESVIADIRDAERLKTEILSFEPDLIFHLAAQPLVRLSYDFPIDTFVVNAMGTAHVMESVRSLDKPCSVVLITTDKVYYNNEWIYPYRENDRLGGYDPYSASKACAELIIDSYRNSFFNKNALPQHQKGIAVARAGNVIGGGDWARDRIVPDVVRALSQQHTIVVRNPNAVRPWQHVLEPICGYLTLGMKLASDPVTFSSAYNFGPYIADTLTVQELVQVAVDIWGSGEYDCPTQEHAPHEAGLLRLDITKAREELNWLPRWNSNQALTQTLNWYKVQLQMGSITEFTEQQIHHFLANETQ
jgi:CDP-glucose 4,6-dehydratase